MDYAILMTTRYKEERMSGKQKRPAITAALAEDLGVGFQNVRITAIKKI